MSKLGKEQVMVAEGMTRRGVSMRQVASQLGVTEGALRYRLKKRAAGAGVDGRSRQPTALDGYEEVVHGLLERLGDGRLTGEARPVQARLIYELLVRDFGYEASYQAVVRYLGRRYGAAKLRALRRVETPPGVQAQHDWFEVRSRLEGRPVRLQVLTGVLSHSRARFCRVSRRAGQLDWQAGHLALFERYGGVPLWVRIDNLKTGVARGAGPTAVVNESYQAFARQCGFEVDACRPGRGSDKGKVERGVRIFRQHFGDLLVRGWDSLETLQEAVDRRAETLLDRLRCPVTGTSVREAHEAERILLQSLPGLGEPFDVLVSRRVSRDCLISFEGRRYSVPFAWTGRQVEVWGTAASVVIRGGGEELTRHQRHTKECLVIEPAHYEGPSTNRVLAPTPLGARARLQVAGLSSPSRRALCALPETVSRPLSAYAAIVEAAR